MKPEANSSRFNVFICLAVKSDFFPEGLSVKNNDCGFLIIVITATTKNNLHLLNLSMRVKQEQNHIIPVHSDGISMQDLK